MDQQPTSINKMSDYIPSKKLNIDKAENILGQFRRANSQNKARRQYSGESDQKYEDRLWLNNLNEFELGHHHQGIADVLGWRDEDGEDVAPRTAFAVEAQIFDRSQKAYAETEWDTTTCEHRMVLLFLAMFGTVEKRSVVAYVTKGGVRQGTDRFHVYLDRVEGCVKSTGDVISQEEHKRIAVAGANDAKPDGPDWLPFPTMKAYLDERQADHSLAELIQKGLRYEAKLMTAAQRFGLPTYLVDDTKIRLKRVAVVDESEPDCIAAAVERGIRSALGQYSTPQQGAKACDSYGPKTVALAQESPAQEHRIASVEEQVALLTKKVDQHSTDLGGLKSTLSSMEAAFGSQFERLFAQGEANSATMAQMSKGKKGGYTPACGGCGVVGHFSISCPNTEAEQKKFRADRDAARAAKSSKAGT